MENNLVKVETDNNETINLLILKEFEYKDKKYAILTEIDNCDEDCECKEDCNCDDNCDCGDNCNCGEECSCGCNENLFLLEITKDENGNEIFKSIDDEKLFDEIIEVADKELNED